MNQLNKNTGIGIRHYPRYSLLWIYDSLTESMRVSLWSNETDQMNPSSDTHQQK